MTTSLTHQTFTPARHKIDLTRSREKLLPFASKKPIVSRRPALYFIRGIQTPPNAPFFPSYPPSLRLRFGAMAAAVNTPHGSQDVLSSTFLKLVKQFHTDVPVVVAQSDGRRFRIDIELHSHNLVVRLSDIGYVGEGKIASDLLLQRHSCRRLTVTARDGRIYFEFR